MENMPVQVWTIARVCTFLGCGRAHVYKLMKTDGDFPAPIRLGRLVRFCASDFEKYIEKKQVQARAGGVV